MRSPLKYIIAICLLCIGTKQLYAQNFDTGKNNYFILSKNIQHLKPIILTANELAKEDGEKYGEFHVVFCEDTVQDIPNNNGFRKLLEEAQTMNIKVFVCGISLKKFNVNPSKLPRSLPIVANGILYGFQLTKKDFITLSI